VLFIAAHGTPTQQTSRVAASLKLITGFQSLYLPTQVHTHCSVYLVLPNATASGTLPGRKAGLPK
jgi:hypothetical protein